MRFNIYIFYFIFKYGIRDSYISINIIRGIKIISSIILKLVKKVDGTYAT